jgi:glycerol-3-phosphate dehydrogenase
VAPHLVRRVPFLLPLYRNGPYHPLAVQAGLWAYSALAGEPHGRLVRAERARESVPPLRVEDLRGCGIYADAWTHDARLCLANVQGAAEAGATVANYAEASAFLVTGGRVRSAEVEDRVGGDHVTVAARAVVNATGPWIDRVRRLEDEGARPCMRLSKGVHAFLELSEPWRAALTIPHDEVRVSFAVPWEGLLLVGTTDVPYECDPDDLSVDETEIETVLGEARVALDPEVVRREAVRSTSAGLRVLPLARGPTTRARRETVFLRGRAGMLTIAGGKLTTYRRIAAGALRALRDDLGPVRVDEAVALPGAVPLAEAARRLASARPEIEPALRLHLAHLYGARAGDVLALTSEDPALLEPLDPAAVDIAAQVVYARRSEWACTAEDVVHRRTTLAAHGSAGREMLGRIEALLARGADVRG